MHKIFSINKIIQDKSKCYIHIKVRLTDVVEVVGAFIEVPISILVVAEAQWRQWAVSPVDDLETVWTLREVVVDNDVLIPLYAKKCATNISVREALYSI